jgi:calcineurin-like phosphoesterase
MHALSVMAKQSLAYALDGEVAAVLGTHTHEATLALHVLPRGTALVTEVGMTGPSGGPQGMNAERVIERVRAPHGPGSAPEGPAGGEIILGAVLLDIEDGVTQRLMRVS